MSDPTPTTQPSRPKLPVIVIGAGEHAKVLLDALSLLGAQVLFVTDHDQARHGRTIGGVRVAGDDVLVRNHDPSEVLLVNAVGSVTRPSARRAVYLKLREEGYRFASVIHPKAIIAPSAQLADAVQIMAGVVVQPDAVLGENVLVNSRASIDHDCRIDAHVHLAPGATLSGSVHVGETSHIGTNATVIQGITIGREVVVGAGAVVVRDVPDEMTVVGVPAKPTGQAKQTFSPPPAKAAASTPTEGEFPAEGGCNILLSAAGRRVALMHLLRGSLDELGFAGQILATDITALSSAYQAAGAKRLVPDYRDRRCLDALLGLCREYHIRLIIPTIDPDLPFYARHRAAFADLGVHLHLSSLETITIGNDKQATHQWLIAQGLPTVRQCPAEQLLVDQGDWSYPLFVKPRKGSSSIGAARVDDRASLAHAIRGGSYITQTLAPGQEYTVDVYLDPDGLCRCAVPRLRLETRSGEVSKGVAAREAAVIDLARRVAEALPGARGVLNIQIFYDKPSGQLNVIEINPRFGGGYPLTHAAGAPMARWVIEEAMGLPCTARDDQWQDGLVMLRYDEAVFVTREQAGLAESGEP
ncbi:MAG: ATP-grasp domain-containing protein [Planctomycetes bacterium]|jgi:carbamoyl-phosphate synthase large subunit|nr:ATP-grasp domain-containing protein [Planctomycetota bacterium]